MISGWACEANQIEIEFSNAEIIDHMPDRWQAGTKTRRPDTQGVCGDTDNGFGLLFNWNRLGDGAHTVRAFADGVEFASVTVTVITLGEEFLRGASYDLVVRNFPEVGVHVNLRWQEAQQNFVITEVGAPQEALWPDWTNRCACIAQPAGEPEPPCPPSYCPDITEFGLCGFQFTSDHVCCDDDRRTRCVIEAGEVSSLPEGGERTEGVSCTRWRDTCVPSDLYSWATKEFGDPWGLELTWGAPLRPVQ